MATDVILVYDLDALTAYSVTSDPVFTLTSEANETVALTVRPGAVWHVDFTVSGQDFGDNKLGFRGAARPSASIAAAAAAAGGGIRVFLMSLADGTHTVSVLARPLAGGGFSFSYLDQHHSPEERRYSFDASGFDRKVQEETEMLINNFPTKKTNQRINQRLTIWRVPR